MHLYLLHRASALDYLPNVIFEPVLLLRARLDYLGDRNLGPSNAVNKDWSYTATLT